MKKNFLFSTLMFLLFVRFSFAQNNYSFNSIPFSIPPPSAAGEIFRFQSGLVTHLQTGNLPTSTTNGFTASDRWLSFGEILGGSQVLQGFRTQYNGRGLTMGLQTSSGILQDPFVQWIGNNSAGVTPGKLNFRFATDPGGSGGTPPTPPVTLFTMEPNTAGTGGNSYATNGLLGHLDAGSTFGSFNASNNWSGIGKVAIPFTSTTLYGARYQYDGSSLITGFREDASASTRDALIEYGNNVNSPGNFRVDELKVRFFTDPNDPSSAVDIAKFRGKFRSVVVGYSTINALSSEPRFAVYDGVGSVPYSNPPFFSTGAIYGLSNGTDNSGAVLTNSAGVVGDVYNTRGSGGYAILGIGPSGPTSAIKWAGYFIGRVFSTGGYTTSDAKLKKNIVKEESALSKLMQLRPMQYHYDTDKYSTMNLETTLQHGFIAQDLEKVFPEMVTAIEAPSPVDSKTKKSSDPFSFKGVNYQQLHAIEVAAIQELQAEIEELKAQLTDKAGAVTVIAEDAVDAKVKANSFMLAQNVPNPFTASTTIKYSIPEKNNAMIAVMDLNGRMLLQFNNLKGASQITINGNTLQAGMYLYTLVVNGQEIITKKMILTK